VSFAACGQALRARSFWTSLKMQRSIALRALGGRAPLGGGLGSFASSEALPGALPRNQNAPQHPPYGLYPELLSGTAFTVPRAKNRYSWLYRIRPSVKHGPSSGADHEYWAHPTYVSPPFTHKYPPIQYAFRPRPFTPAQGTDFIDGAVTMAANGSPTSQDGIAACTYQANSSMSAKGRVMRNHDSDVLILPQEGELEIRTEFGDMRVGPCDLALIQRGMTFQVNLAEGTDKARGYFMENYGDFFVIPDAGPIGVSSGLAAPRHFLPPDAKFDDEGTKGPFELVTKMNGDLWKSPLEHSPFDVVAWYGNFTPYKYDMRLFCRINTVTYDHPDPSIYTVLSSYTSSPGLANCDFVIFPPRWLVSENSYRPPWPHRNAMSEFMGLIQGSYDAKPDVIAPGSCTIHNRFVPHGPDQTVIDKLRKADTTVPHRMEDTMAFMWETRLLLHPSEYALATLNDETYPECWSSVKPAFDRNNVPPIDEPYPFNPGKTMNKK